MERACDHRVLFLGLHSSSWGDGLFATRMLKDLKQDRLSVVYYAEHEFAARYNGPLYANEGLVDDVMQIPKSIAESGDKDAVLEFLRAHYGLLTFDTVVLGWFFDVDMDEILDDPMFDGAELLCVCDQGHVEKHLPDREVRGLGPQNQGTAWDMWSMDEDLGHLWSLMDPDKKTLAFMPESTRKPVAVHARGVAKLIKGLKDEWNIVLLGLERASYYASLWGGHPELTNRDIPWMREHGYLDGAFDVVGWGAVKQAAVLKRVDRTLISSTGAICLPQMLRVPFVLMYGGNYSIEGLCHYGGSSYVTVSPHCELYPCNTGVNPGEVRTMYDDCESDAPRCLDTEINVAGVLEALRA